MENNQLIAEKREASTKGAARAMRRAGRIPAVLYGEGKSQTLSVDAKEWASRFKNAQGNTIVNLKLSTGEHSVLIKDVQEDILTDNVRHIDFYAISADRKLHTVVPLLVEGNPIGVREGGILEHKVEQLEVVCLPKDIPTRFTVNISELGVGESLHISDVPVPPGVEVRNDPAETVVVITHAKSEAAAGEGMGEEDAAAAGEGAESAGE